MLINNLVTLSKSIKLHDLRPSHDVVRYCSTITGPLLEVSVTDTMFRAAFATHPPHAGATDMLVSIPTLKPD
jgi:hypothetical protein